MLYNTKNPHGGDIYDSPVELDYSANINPFGTPPAVKRAMADALEQVVHYPDPYCRKLVAAISAHEGVPESYILCGNGAAELIYSYAEAVHARRALETAPTFSEYSLALEKTGCEVLRYELGEEDGFALDEGFVEMILREKSDVVCLCTPNNPTGRLTDLDLLRRILFACDQAGSRLFLDECFLDLADGGVSMKSFLADHPGLFILRAFTKSYGMAGVRLGYCMTSDGDLLAEMAQTVQPWNVSVIAQAAGIAAMGENDFVEKARQVISAERPWLFSELERIGCRPIPSDANFLLFKGPAGLDGRMRQMGIAIRSCSNYHGLGDGWYRIAVRSRKENTRLMTAMAKAVEEV